MLIALAALVLLVGAADFTYDRVVHARHDKWEANVVKRHADGTRVGYEEFSCGTGRVALLMVHGFAAGPITFGRMAPALAERGFACHAILLPGYGRPIGEYEKATRDQWRAAIREKISELHAKHDAVWLVGHSMGGTLSALEALDRRSQADGLVLLAPLFEVCDRRSPVLSPRALHAITRVAVFTDLTQLAFPLDAKDPELRANAIRDDFVPRSIYNQLFALTDEVEGRGPELKLPVLLVTAPDDLVASPAAAREWVAAATNAPRRTLLEQTTSGHVVTWDHGWDKTAAAIADFIHPPQP